MIWNRSLCAFVTRTGGDIFGVDEEKVEDGAGVVGTCEVRLIKTRRTR